MENQVIYGVAVVPLIIAAVALAKQVGLPQKFGGVVAWGLGVGTGLAYGPAEGWGVAQCVLVGSALGLTAAGLYSTQKNARETESG